LIYAHTYNLLINATNHGIHHVCVSVCASQVGLDNPYLSSTIEMSVIDSKPWGLGARGQGPHLSSQEDALGSRSRMESAANSNGAWHDCETGKDSLQGSRCLSNVHPLPSFPLGPSTSAAGTTYPSSLSAQPPLWGYACAYTQEADGSTKLNKHHATWTLKALEERHPLAWAHMANHPGPGKHARRCKACMANMLSRGTSIEHKWKR